MRVQVHFFFLHYLLISRSPLYILCQVCVIFIYCQICVIFIYSSWMDCLLVFLKVLFSARSSSLFLIISDYYYFRANLFRTSIIPKSWIFFIIFLLHYILLCLMLRSMLLLLKKNFPFEFFHCHSVPSCVLVCNLRNFSGKIWKGPPYREGKQRPKKEAEPSTFVGGRFSKHGNIYEVCLGSPKMSKCPHLPPES